MAEIKYKTYHTYFCNRCFNRWCDSLPSHPFPIQRPEEQVTPYGMCVTACSQPTCGILSQELRVKNTFNL